MKLIGLGAGGHAKVVIEILQLMGQYELMGLLDPLEELWGTDVLGIPVLGDDSFLPELYDQGVRGAFIGVGAVGNTQSRIRLYENVCQQGFRLVDAIHPQAIISPSARLGDGPTIMAGSVINAKAALGNDVIINTGAIVEHDCLLGDHVHIATGAQLAGGVRVGDGAHIGMGASIRQGITIGSGVIVGAGAVVVKDVAPDLIVTGVPASPLQKNDID